ncbi:MAG: ectoine synthase [Hyphomicrobiales bacterium]|nr:ectoine synthase [Hyphomicrobiales bacterium]MBV8824399.1 ectoine synthase [Hyphomicrobiales bacterium]
MIIRNLNDVINSSADVAWGNGESRRLLLARDGMGFSLTDTLVRAGSESFLEYRHHLEACYCIEGEGEVEDMNGNRHAITRGTMYALDKHEPHYLRAFTDLRLICIFLPPLLGPERHDLGGKHSSSY